MGIIIGEGNALCRKLKYVCFINEKESVVNCSIMAIMAAKTNANSSSVISIAAYCYYLETPDILKIVSRNRYFTYALQAKNSTTSKESPPHIC